MKIINVLNNISFFFLSINVKFKLKNWDRSKIKITRITKKAALRKIGILASLPYQFNGIDNGFCVYCYYILLFFDYVYTLFMLLRHKQRVYTIIFHYACIYVMHNYYLLYVYGLADLILTVANWRHDIFKTQSPEQNHIKVYLSLKNKFTFVYFCIVDAATKLVATDY